MIEHICLDVDDTLYPVSEKFKEAKANQIAKRLVQLLKKKNDLKTIKKVESFLKQGGFNLKYDQITTEAYKFLVEYEKCGNGGNANTYKSLGLDYRWVERDIFYAKRENLIDWSYSQEIIETLREIRLKGISLSLFSNSSYGSIALNLKYSGFTPAIQEELFGTEITKLFASEEIGETESSLTDKLRKGEIDKNEFEYMLIQYKAKMDFIKRKINILSSEDKEEYKRPALGGFERIKQCLDIPSENILYVGDTIKKDIIPAKKAGLKACLVLWDRKEKSNNADYVINQLMELKNII